MQLRYRELAVRSVVCIAAFLLLDCLEASAGKRELLALVEGSQFYSEVFQRVIHTSWLGPGLILAAFLALAALLSGSGSKSKKANMLSRKIRAPKLDRYRGRSPKRHQDLEV